MIDSLAEKDDRPLLRAVIELACCSVNRFPQEPCSVLANPSSPGSGAADSIGLGRFLNLKAPPRQAVTAAKPISQSQNDEALGLQKPTLPKEAFAVMMPAIHECEPAPSDVSLPQESHWQEAASMLSISFRNSFSFSSLGFALVACAIFSTGCGGGKPATPAASIESGDPAAAPATNVSTTPSPPAESVPVSKVAVVDPVVLIQTSAGDIKLQLAIQKAPQTVDNFLRNYVNRGFYEQTIVHHVDKGSLLAAGGYTADLQPKPTRAPIYNEAANGLKNKRGTISMARDPGVAHSGTSQFFLNVVDNEGLDYLGSENDADFGYCVFGQVIEGMEVIDRISQLAVAAQGDFPAVPQQAVVIQSVKQLK